MYAAGVVDADPHLAGHSSSASAQPGQLPIAYADYFDAAAGWDLGWGSGIRHPHPPLAPEAQNNCGITGAGL